ncbi:Colicin-E9 immunity protein [Vibrio aerogenes CECT 7868]|uniref:Colicin-E9 immunity protein n=1 Tax=Vibrio aerogenes CECT 7868 TaxID=1216006 RepID=A0A1M5YQD3_9VIBR|nr:bacteriocin immunity protein [Vibrio aerogenes]SHI14266.1 Colicin-E9 immunity protein [Vibrio aerogenes CECT 7868]
MSFKKQTLEKYTQSEFTDLLRKICKADTNTEEELDLLIEHFEEITEHPDGSDLIYYPDDPADATPERIVEIVKEWRLSQGLPCFKD